LYSDHQAFHLSRFNDEVKHIKVVEKDNWIHITEAKKFESLLVRASVASAAPDLCGRGQAASPPCFLLTCSRPIHFS
jgi:hypothetical protein